MDSLIFLKNRHIHYWTRRSDFAVYHEFHVASNNFGDPASRAVLVIVILYLILRICKVRNKRVRRNDMIELNERGEPRITTYLSASKERKDGDPIFSSVHNLWTKWSWNA